MMSPRVLVTLVGVACIALVALLLADMPAPAAAAKFIASTAFVALAIRSGALASVYGRLILTGLALSWCGDMFLIGLSKTTFLAGLFAFLMAHVAYVAAFVRHGFERRWIGVAMIPVTAIAIGVFVWLEPYTPPDLLNPVRAYVAVISLMVIFAIGTQGRGASKLIVAGATLFFLSDLSVASLRLVQTQYPTYIIGLPLYYAGQICLALSSSHSRSH
ncbi:MAG: lysoplasmalogenase [Gammaproteobacteria bacterium]|nr:lysoplasmalogenase [Gammaproteobacteria bacterium]